MGVTALVDDREPRAVVRAIRNHPDVDGAAVERLVAGDVVVGDVGFERKTPGDYARSALGRTGTDLRAQVERLAEAHSHAYLLLEGNLPADGDEPRRDGSGRRPTERDRPTDCGRSASGSRGSGPTFRDSESAFPGSAASLRGSMASITARQGVPVIPCGDLPRLADMAIRLGRKHAEEPSPRPLAAGAVTDRREPVAKRMYGCIDGVGPETAARLYDAFPTVASLARATRADLLSIDGVGPKRATAIREAVGSAKRDEA